jgi:hypothetical protein
LREDGGNYEDAFGVNDELHDFWDDKTFEQGLFALVVYLHVLARMKEPVRPRDQVAAGSAWHAHIVGGDEAKPPVFGHCWRLCCVGPPQNDIPPLSAALVRWCSLCQQDNVTCGWLPRFFLYPFIL